MTLPVVPVVDTGVDDALALVVAARHPRLDLRAVVCTAGNVPLDRVLANTGVVLNSLGVDVPIAAGAQRRLDGTPFPVRGVHGADGLAGLAIDVPPAASRLPGRPDEVVPESCVVVSLGPLTSIRNLAVGRRVVASYARPGEPNYLMDPAAAAGSRYEPVDVSAHSVAEAAAVLAGPGSGPVLSLVAALLAHQAARGAGLGDAAVMLMLAEPELASSEWARRVIELAGAEDWPG